MQNATTTGVGRRALVTGGAHGIGWAICQLLAKRGYTIALADLDAKMAQQRTSILGDGHVALPVDLTDMAAAAALPNRAAVALGGLDVVVNNAGMTDASGKSLIALPAASFDRLIALNLGAVEKICDAAGKLLGPGGSIVNIASGASYRPLALRGPYSATKAAIVELTSALSKDFEARGICVSAVAPGYTRTPLVEELHRAGQVNLDEVTTNIPMGRLATPEDIASVVAFAASVQGGVLTGQTLLVDGGGSAGPAPAHGAPRGGSAPDGCIAILGSTSELGPNCEALISNPVDRNELQKISALSAVVDIEALDRHRGSAEALSLVRDTAITCAALNNRTRDFALLYVLPDGDDSNSKAASAASAMLARTLALEWAQSGMRVNAIRWRGKSRKGLWELCRFLVGPDAGFITGQIIWAGD